MAWDRVIQDSDEDEPLLEDDIQTSIDPPRRPEPQLQQHHDPNVEHQIDYPMEHTTTQNSTTESHLHVNFDSFLQSQEGPQGSLTLSQQRREERWIPSTGEGGGGSIGAGAMMTEIGLAQQRLLDDEASSAGQRLPSTATPYSSEISQPGSFPAMPMYQYQHMEGHGNDGFVYARAGQDVTSEATQLVPQVQAHVYDYSTPGTSAHTDSPMAAPETTVSESTSVRPYPSQKSSHRSKSLQSPYSPHDTEPMSSIVSPRLSRAKSDNAKWGPMSPRSPADTHDELSLPAVAVEISTVTKKRGRPKKSSLPEDDEDDELAGPRESETEQPKTEKKRPGRPKKVATDRSAGADDASMQGDANAEDAPEMPPVTESKKKKLKRSKTADAILQKSQASTSDDDVIWVESNPILTNEPKEQSDSTSNLHESNPSESSKSAPTTSNEACLEVEEPSTTKTRGRKRKKTTDQLALEANEATKETQPPEPPSNVCIRDDTPLTTTTSTLEPGAEEETTPDPAPTTNTNTNTTLPTTPKEAAPQTPQKPEQSKTDPNTNTNPRSSRGPGQHSPISSTSKVPYRVGLSKRARIAPLLKVVRK